MPINFTIVHNAKTNDEDDDAGDIGAIAVTGWLHFIAQLPEGMPALDAASGTGYWIRKFEGYLDDDGVLKNEPGGTPGVHIWANDPAFGLEELPYLVYAPKGLRANGKIVPFTSFVFNAPSAAVEKKLTELSPVPSVTAQGISRGLPGPANALAIGSVVAGDDAGATITGESPEQQLNLVLPRGIQGPPGPLGILFTWRGMWNASTNSPALADGTGSAGDARLTSVGGTVNLGSGDLEFDAGDVVAYDGAVWVKVPPELVQTAGFIVVHGGDADYPRPPIPMAWWDGWVFPNNSLDSDKWFDSSGEPPAILTEELDGMNVDAPFNQTLVAEGTQPILWKVVDTDEHPGVPPADMVLSTGGNLHGKPDDTVDYDFWVMAENPFGSALAHYTGSVEDAIGPTILTTSFGDLTTGVTVSIPLSASGSTPITWSVVDEEGSEMPAGLDFDEDGDTIIGTLTTPGPYSVKLRAMNSVGYADKVFSGVVEGSPPSFTTVALNPIWRAFAFTQDLVVAGAEPITITKTAGDYPGGLSRTGLTISGATPTPVGPYSFKLKLENDWGQVEKTFTGSILESTPTLAETELNVMELGVPFTQTLTVTGGPTLTSTVTGGALPDGVMLESDGEITGTPEESGTGSVEITVSNGVENVVREFDWTVAVPVPVFSAVGNGTGVVGNTYTFSISPAAGDTVLAFVGYYNTANNSGVSVTCNGAAMTAVGSPVTHGFVGGVGYFFALFKISGVSAGAQNVVVTTAASGTIKANAVAYSSVTTVGSLQGAGVTTGSTSLTQTASSSAGKVLVQAFWQTAATSGPTLSSYSGTSRSNNSFAAGGIGSTMVIGEDEGDTSVVFTASSSAAGRYSRLAVELAA